MAHSGTLSRRSLIARAAILAAGAGAASAARAYTPQCPAGTIPAAPPLGYSDAVPLGQIARMKNLKFGVQASIGQGGYGSEMYDTAYRDLILSEQPSFLSCGNGFKFGNLCGADAPGADKQLKFTNSAYQVADTWYEANDLTGFCKQRGLKVTADALIWNSQNPAWLQPLSASGWQTSAAYLSNMDYLDKFISAAMKKIVQISAGDSSLFQTIGVVNEPLDPFTTTGGGATYAGGGFIPNGVSVASLSTAAPYIADALTKASYYNQYWATQLGLAPTQAKLLINETLTDTDQYGPVQRAALLELVRKLKAAGAPLQAVGLECHLQPQMMNAPNNPDWTAFSTFLQQLADLGVEIHITELDVFDYAANCNGHKASAAESDALTALYFFSFARAALANTAVKSLCLWNLSDRYTPYRTFDVSTWFNYQNGASGGWPKCNVMPQATNIACPRASLYDDAYMPKKSLRQKLYSVMNALQPR